MEVDTALSPKSAAAIAPTFAELLADGSLCEHSTPRSPNILAPATAGDGRLLVPDNIPAVEAVAVDVGMFSSTMKSNVFSDTKSAGRTRSLQLFDRSSAASASNETPKSTSPTKGGY